jgi:hypothetical protein
MQDNERGKAQSRSDGERKGQRAEPRSGSRDQTTGQGQREQSQRGEGQPDRSQERTEQGQRRSPSQKDGQASERSQSGQDDKGKSQQTSGQSNPGQAQSRPDQTGNGDRMNQRESEQTRQPGQQPSQQQAGRTEGTVSLSADQRTRIRATVLAGNNVPRVERVNFTIRVGTVVPSTIRVVAVPPTLVEIYPQWRSYSYFIVEDDIIIVDNSHRIVSVVPVGSGGAAQYDSRDNDRVVGVSMTTEEIRRIQVILRDRGYTIEVDGIMGPQTRDAIIAFQRREGIEATGQIDQRTSAALGVDAKQVGPSGRPAGDRNQAGQQPAADQPGNQPTTTGQDMDKDPSRSQQRPENAAPGKDTSPPMNDAAPRQGTKNPSDAGRSPATR